MKIIPDAWQQEVLDTKGNICLRSGRQVGKSTVISMKAGDYALNNPKMTIMVIASVERQARLLFEKILAHIYEKNKSAIMKGKDRPTKHQLKLKNGSVIYCLPTGESGYGIRGYTINLLIADEAAFIPEDVWTAVTPMLAVTRGTIWLLSTPHGKEGYFYRMFEDESFTTFHVSAEDCPRKDEKFLAEEKKRMTNLQYQQEYLGEFIDDLRQLFPNKLIRQCMTQEKENPKPNAEYYLGVDIARMGEDQSTFEVLDATNPNNIRHTENLMTEKTKLTETIDRIIMMNRLYQFKKIGIDDAGIGAGVYDVLHREEETKRKIIGLNNAKRSIEKKFINLKMRERKKTLLKEDMYFNLLNYMEKGEIQLLNENEVFLSLSSIQYEYADDGKLKIFGNYTHIVEGLIRAAWLIKTKGLNIYAF